MQAELILRIWTQGRKRLPSELPEAFAPHAKHVQHLLEQGYLSGEIVDDRFSGWWEIKQ